MCPIFEFSCDECGQVFESFMRPNDPVQCSKCGCNNATKLVSQVATHIWKCSPDGAMPSKKNHFELDRKAAKKERVDNITNKQLAEYK